MAIRQDRDYSVSVGDKFTSPGFSPVQYVAKNFNSVQQLFMERTHIANLADETNNLLKKNVYKNYTQFIETAKEIRYLESEMYQLSHMLTEQHGVLQALLEISVTDDKGSGDGEGSNEKKEEDCKRNISTLLEKVEGCTHILDDRDRQIVHSSEIMELDHDFNPYKKMYAVLLTDCLLLANYLPSRRGPVQYRFQTTYELDSLAVVNIREDHQCKNSFKILMFPHTRVFQCETNLEKRQWVETIEQTKKAKMSATTLRRESMLLDPKNPFIQEDRNAFEEEENEDCYEVDRESVFPDWLIELPEDLDVCIAVRDFEQAVNLVQKANEHFSLYPKSASLKEMRPRIDYRIKNLVDVLSNELRISPDRSLQGGPRSARRAVSLLIKLGKSSQACELFLKHRSSILKYSIRQQKMEGATALYIGRLCSVFFNNMLDTGKEFSRVFGNNNNCASGFAVWSKNQLQTFVKMFSNHVFTTQVSLSVATECIVSLRIQSQQLWAIGFDVSFILEKLLQNDIDHIITESRDKALEAIKLRAAEDRWKPQNLQNKQGIQRLLDDMSLIGVKNIKDYVYDECWLSLASNTLAFTKTFFNLLEDLLKLYISSRHVLIAEALILTFRAHLRHVESSLLNPVYKTDVKFIQKNAEFLTNYVMPLADKRCEKIFRQASLLSSDVRSEFPALVVHRSEGEGKSTTEITKYPATAYL